MCFTDDPRSAPERDIAQWNYALSGRSKQSEIDGIPLRKPMKGRYERCWHDAPLSGTRCVVTEPGWLQVDAATTMGDGVGLAQAICGTTMAGGLGPNARELSPLRGACSVGGCDRGKAFFVVMVSLMRM